MKKLILIALMFAIPFAMANAETKITVGAAGDTYYVTDNASISSYAPSRQFATTNIYKDRFTTNNALLDAAISGEGWRGYFSVAHLPQRGIMLQDLNVGINLFKGLWIEGGYYVSWEGDYTFGANKWFTESSLTESIFGMAKTYSAWGLKYQFNPNLSLAAGVMNNGLEEETYYDISRQKTKGIYAKFDGTNLIDNWGLTASVVHNSASYGAGPVESPDYPTSFLASATEFYLFTQGSIIKDLDGQLMAKFALKTPADDWIQASNLLSFQAMARYHFTPKIAAGIRVAYTIDNEKPGYNSFYFDGNSGLDIGVLCQYNPTPNVYLRLEGGMLSLSNSDNDALAKVFMTGDTSDGFDESDRTATRLNVALSMGFRVSLFENTIGE